MKTILGIVTIVLMTLARPVLAEPSLPVPGAQNSGAGIAGYAGDESGPAVHVGTVGAAATYQMHALRRMQDAAKIPGLAGTESGRAEKASSRHA